MSELPNAVEIHNLRKSHRGEVILDGVSLSAARGKIIALLGESGAGKTTLLRCLNLLEIPEEGQLSIAGLDFTFSSKSKRPSKQSLLILRQKVGIVFQQFYLWGHMTILDNLIEAPRYVLGLPKEQVIEKANMLLKQIGLSEKTTAYPDQLSGGQQQRVAIARALMMGPEIMLFDEPTSALDPQRTADTLQLIRELADQGMTVIVASHDMTFVRELSDKTVFLSHGKIIESGDTKILFHSPQTKLFQDFIGEH